MAIVTGLLTFVLMVIALFLILLVLVQLPKKDAGVGMAFGAGMSEMLLGAGSGNVLTRITKYTVVIFLGLSLLVSMLISSQHRTRQMGLAQAIEEQARTAPVPAPAPVQAPVGSGLQSLGTSPDSISPADGPAPTIRLQGAPPTIALPVEPPAE